jgi:2-methylisocitrate lyase-like PEP mutase family enzyme
VGEAALGWAALLATKRTLLVPGVANALAARVAEDIGFDALYVTGAGIANTYLGAPDIGLVTLTELADHVARIADAVALPLIADADTGFGNAVNTGRAVRLLERSGAAAIQLEDQVFPKKCGHFAGKATIPAPEMAAKVRAAVDARRDAGTWIVARTDARASDGLDAALDRARLYIEAGADMTFVEAPESRDEMARIARELPVPQIANIVIGGRTPELPLEDLSGMGFAVALYANAALQAAVKAMQDVLGHLKRTGSAAGLDDRLASFAERQRVVDKDRWDALEARYRTS